MTVQTSYSATPAIGQPGMIVQEFALRQVDSYLAEGAILFGFPCVAGTAAGQVKSATAAADRFLGIAVAELNLEEAYVTNVANYVDKQAISVLKYGRVYVQAGEAVLAGESVFAGATSAGERGKFYNDSGSSTRIDVKGKWVADVANGAVGAIELYWSV